MRTRIFLIFCSLALLSACVNDDVPGDVLAPEKMEVVLWDLMRADELVAERYIRDSSLSKVGEATKEYGKVMGIHGISQADFKRSYGWYTAHPKALKPILDSLRAIPLSLPTITTPAARKQIPVK